MLTGPQFFQKEENIPRGARIIDKFADATQELFIIERSELKHSFSRETPAFQNFLHEREQQALWVYYPWNNTAIRIYPEQEYCKIRTARNRNIITKEEQERYRNTSVGIAGLSVGSAVLSALTMTGGPRCLKIADFDTLELSNLNRIKATLLDLGAKKTDIAAKNTWEIDPFANISLFETGLNEQNLEEFLRGNPKLDVFIDEMDNISMKIRVRRSCRTHRIPVIMVTDNGNGVILDIERFDAEPERPLLHGIMEDMDPETIEHLDFQNWTKVANKIVGSESLSERMLQSIQAIGTSLSGIPQLGTSASVGGAVAAFSVRAIANNLPMPSGRYHINFETLFLA